MDANRSAEPGPVVAALGPELVSLRAFKIAVRELPPDHHVRALIESEADMVPEDELRIKCGLWARLLVRLKGEAPRAVTKAAFSSRKARIAAGKSTNAAVPSR